MNKIYCKVQIHFEGDITENHRLPVRTLGKSLVHIQNAFDRAFLDLKYINGVYKHARMKNEDYIQNELWIGAPKKGSYIANLFSISPKSKETADRVSHAINQVLKDTSEPQNAFRRETEKRKLQIINEIVKPISFSDSSSITDPAIVRKYGDRSISKEIDEILTIIRSDYAGDSTLEISITGTATIVFDFNKDKSIAFHKAVAKKSFGKPVFYKGSLQSLDKKNLVGKFLNSENNRTSLLHITDESDFLKIHPYLGDIGDIEFIGCPLIEFGSLEPNSGDIFFIMLNSEYEKYKKSS